MFFRNHLDKKIYFKIILLLRVLNWSFHKQKGTILWNSIYRISIKTFRLRRCCLTIVTVSLFVYCVVSLLMICFQLCKSIICLSLYKFNFPIIKFPSQLKCRLRSLSNQNKTADQKKQINFYNFSLS